MTRTILVTAALPYANGPIHIGHLVEYIQTDIWVRFQKMRANDCIYCCADDTHGTPIMIRARQEGIDPERLIARMHAEHTRDFADFDVAFDNYYSTHSPENRRLSETIFSRLREAGHIAEREVEQAYCARDAMFLPDRFIRGACPKCGAPDQYGDSCEVCHATYTPVELADARCSVCGTPPERRRSLHYFFRLADFTEPLQEWIAGGHVHEQVQNKLQEWFAQGLRDWDISRDAPYFGFLIPGETDKYFYVWLDAPIGYMASTMDYCRRTGRDFEAYWCDPATEIVHFLGKDITYFHALFWPAMLMGSGFNAPRRLVIHGFLTVNGEKMSKSRGTFVSAATYLRHLDPQYLRYYYACKLGPGTEDIDLNLDDFVSRIDSDLVGKLANLASRSVPMLNKNLEGRCGALSEEARRMLAPLQEAAETIAADYESCNYAAAVRRICHLADEVNRYVDQRKPWLAIRQDREHARETLTATLNAVRILTVYLKPVLPGFAAKIETMLGLEPLQWSHAGSVWEHGRIGGFERLLERVDPEKVNAMIEESKMEQPQDRKETSQPSPLEAEPLAPEISFDEFMKVDLRLARVVRAETVDGADKLLRLELDLGGPKRTVLAGIRQAYDPPERLVGRLLVVAANLAPRKMKFGVSEGMILAAGPGGSEVFCLTADAGSQAGQRVH
ncbi:MAG: methionine--tRNA ligase [Sedimentisphaerales bacterium]|nr:methionine--tRNA ligase [Sedimentisphaerales bacterium]